MTNIELVLYDNNDSLDKGKLDAIKFIIENDISGKKFNTCNFVTDEKTTDYLLNRSRMSFENKLFDNLSDKEFKDKIFSTDLDSATYCRGSESDIYIIDIGNLQNNGDIIKNIYHRLFENGKDSRFIIIAKVSAGNDLSIPFYNTLKISPSILYRIRRIELLLYYTHSDKSYMNRHIYKHKTEKLACSVYAINDYESIPDYGVYEKIKYNPLLLDRIDRKRTILLVITPSTMKDYIKEIENDIKIIEDEGYVVDISLMTLSSGHYLTHGIKSLIEKVKKHHTIVFYNKSNNDNDYIKFIVDDLLCQEVITEDRYIMRREFDYEILLKLEKQLKENK